jgi:GT2 family glycosyltransferase
MKKNMFKKFIKFKKIINHYRGRKNGFIPLIKWSIFFIKNKGFWVFFSEIRNALSDNGRYEINNGGCDFEHDPLVSVIIVSYKSAKDLIYLLPSLAAQSYKKFEIVIVKNDDEDIPETNKYLDNSVKIIRSPGNIGFAAANNIGLSQAVGELICLVNPDTELDEDCFLNLVTQLRHDSNVGVSVPKIRFWDKFIDLIIESDGYFEISAEAFEGSLVYKKIFFLNGIKEDGRYCAVNNFIKIRVPVTNAEFKFKIFKEDFGYIAVYPERNRVLGMKRFKLNSKGSDLVYSMKTFEHPSAAWVINNAGSGVRETGPFDIGFGEYDYGAYDEAKYVDAFCGCIAMIRRSVIINQKIFIDEFFAYYEDSEFSNRLSSNNVKIKYCPHAIVRHRHSATSEEGSLIWRILTTRSKIIYDSICIPSKKNGTFNELKILNYEGLPTELSDMLQYYDKKLLDVKDFDELKLNDRKNIAIYNSYWNTSGGGEMHALAVALAIKGDMDVWLLSEIDFDIDYLGSYFGLDLSGFKKIISPTIDVEMTKKFDIFINSTYNSNLMSAAKKSYYIVSFPHKEVSSEILSAYKFLHNSEFTKKWALKYWKEHDLELVYPILQFQSKIRPSIEKDNLILNVGRFTNRGHAKNQDFIVKAFINSFDNRINNSKLIFCGSLDYSSGVDVDYFENLKLLSEGYPIEFYPNCSKDFLSEMYNRAKFYVHAAGLGFDCEKNPEKMEHFGIAVFEAIASGCFPIVYQYGGPAEMCTSMNLGRTFDSFKNLVSLIDEMEFMNISGDVSKSIVDAAIDFIKSNKIIVGSLMGK